MKTAQLAGHDDTRPALLNGFDLQLFAEEGEGGAGDAGNAADSGAAGTGGANGAGDGTSAGAGEAGKPDVGADAGADGKTADDKAADGEGKPIVPDKYDITVPDGFTVDEAQLNEFTGVAHELGLTNDQANQLVGMHTKAMQDAFQALNEARTQEVISWGEDAKKELGKDYDGTLRDVALGLQAVESDIPGLRAAMDKTGFGNTIEGIRLMAAIGKLVGEDQGGKDAGGKSTTGGDDVGKLFFPNSQK